MSVGEAKNVWRAYARNEACSCSSPANACPVWAPIGAELGYLHAGKPTLRPDELRRLADDSLRLGRLIGPGRHSAAEATLATELGRLYAATARSTGAHTVVDTSKTPNLCRVLAGSLPDFFVVHLVRDPRGVALSESQPKGSPGGDDMVSPPSRRLTRSAVHWAATNSLVERQVAATGVRHHRIRYEDLVADPLRELTALAGAFGLGGPDWPLVAGAHARAELRSPVSHQLAGNPDRFKQGNIPLEPDLRWMSELSDRSRQALELGLQPWMRRYRYPRLGARPRGRPYRVRT